MVGRILVLSENRNLIRNCEGEIKGDSLEELHRGPLKLINGCFFHPGSLTNEIIKRTLIVLCDLHWSILLLCEINIVMSNPSIRTCGYNHTT